jgi:hypothetical protein
VIRLETREPLCNKHARVYIMYVTDYERKSKTKKGCGICNKKPAYLYTLVDSLHKITESMTKLKQEEIEATKPKS